MDSDLSFFNDQSFNFAESDVEESNQRQKKNKINLNIFRTSVKSNDTIEGFVHLFVHNSLKKGSLILLIQSEERARLPYLETDQTINDEIILLKNLIDNKRTHFKTETSNISKESWKPSQKVDLRYIKLRKIYPEKSFGTSTNKLKESSISDKNKLYASMVEDSAVKMYSKVIDKKTSFFADLNERKNEKKTSIEQQNPKSFKRQMSKFGKKYHEDKKNEGDATNMNKHATEHSMVEENMLKKSQNDQESKEKFQKNKPKKILLS